MAPAVPYREHSASPDLSEHVECFWLERPATSRVQRVVPDGAVDFIFDLVRAKGIVVGAMTRPCLAPVEAASTTLAIRFRPGGAARFLAIPLDELTDREAPLADFWPDAGALAERLAETPHLGSAIEVLRGRLRSHLSRSTSSRARSADPQVVEVIRLLTSSTTTVGRASESLGCSRQHLAREIRRVTGLSPKQLSRVARCRRVLTLLPEHATDLVGLAAASGYFDQAHMTGEFTRLVGVPPAKYLRERSDSKSPRPTAGPV
jgi:AraC-like DNA-binding protein